MVKKFFPRAAPPPPPPPPPPRARAPPPPPPRPPGAPPPPPPPPAGSHLGKTLDRRRHRLGNPGVAERVAGIVDHPHFRIGPDRRQGVGGAGWAEEDVAALDDDAADAGEAVGVGQELVGRHEAVMAEIVRFHQRRGREAR